MHFNLSLYFTIPFTDIRVTLLQSHLELTGFSLATLEFYFEILGFDNAEAIICCHNDDDFWHRSLLDISIYSGIEYYDDATFSEFPPSRPDGSFLQEFNCLFFSIYEKDSNYKAIKAIFDERNEYSDGRGKDSPTDSDSSKDAEV